ncbi:hypothetical protein PVAP13_5KG178414 [Panicum virgatum]|uniref:Uncharacterized protein n=1 Tax=Panicum virgatum TaxID=38727 RepID=A0A8T0SDM5_PANVG|nr:hypothetical protein PVAP13_5KG178414 [Panicum virgatum]
MQPAQTAFRCKSTLRRSIAEPQPTEPLAIAHVRCSPSVLVPAAARRAPPIPCVARPAATRAGRCRSPRAATLARPVPRASRRLRRSPRGRAAAALAHSQCRAPHRAPEAAASASEASTAFLMGTGGGS